MCIIGILKKSVGMELTDDLFSYKILYIYTYIIFLQYAHLTNVFQGLLCQADM